MAAPATLRLDNASNIYPASLSKKYASLYRMCVSLDHRIDETLLQKALEATVRRIPNFGYTLRNGTFWWYLKKIPQTPALSPLSGLKRFDFGENDDFLFRVSPDGCRIVLDVFHVLSDGHGSMVFLMTLVGDYLRRYNKNVFGFNNFVFNTEEEPSIEELADRFDAFSGMKGQLEQNEVSYHITGHTERYDILHDIRFKLPTGMVKQVAGRYGCTVTDLLAAAMISALQEVHRNDRRIGKNDCLKVNIPVDLRRIFGGNTFRNFSSYVNVGVDVRNGYHSFDNIVQDVALQKKLYTMPAHLEPKIAKNVELEDNFAIASIPRFLKKPIIDIINKLKGDRYCSHTLSNLGLVELPESMRPHVKEIDFILGRQRGNSGAGACVGYGESLYLHFSRKIRETDFEEYFSGQLEALGIPYQRTDAEL